MTEPSTDGFRSVAASAEIANDTVVPRYLRERKVRVSIARVDARLYAFDDLCRCGREPCPLSGGLLTGGRSCASATAPGSTSRPAPSSTVRRPSH